MDIYTADLSNKLQDRSSIFLKPSVTVLSYIYFLALVVVVERIFIGVILDEGAYMPNPLWQFIWPLSLAAISLLLPIVFRWVFLFVFGCCSVFILAADATYYEFFGTVTSLFMFKSAHQLVDVRDSIYNLLSSKQLAYIFLFIPFLFLALLSIKKKQSSENQGELKKRWTADSRVWGAFTFIASLIVAAAAWQIPIYEDTHHLNRSKWVRPAEHWNSKYSRSSYASTFGVFNYHVMDLIAVVKRSISDEPLSDQRIAEINQVLDHKKEMNKRTSPFYGLARGRQVVIVQLESLQHFLLGLEVNGREVMPALNQLTEASLSWDFIFDVTYLGRTSDAEFAAMTGLLPDTREPVSYAGFSEDLVSLPKEMKRHGYSTASLHGYKKAFWNRAYTHPAYGIDEMHFGESFSGKPKLGLGISDEELYKYSVDLLLDNTSAKQFQYLISLSSHHPYVYVAEKYMEPYSHLGADKGYGLIAPYLASATYADEALGKFLKMLKTKSLLENTLLVIYGDHDRGGLGTSKAIPEVGNRMYAVSEDRIPLVIAIPGKEGVIRKHGAEFRNIMGGLQDLAPTILHLLGEDVPRGMMGTHLFVNNDYRDAIPLPTYPGLFAYRGVMGLPGGTKVTGLPDISSVGPIPSKKSAYKDQLILQDLLDSYERIIVGGF